MIPKHVGDLAAALADEYGGNMEDHIRAAYRIAGFLRKAGARIEYPK